MRHIVLHMLCILVVLRCIVHENFIGEHGWKIAKYVARCTLFQQVKAKRQKPSVLGTKLNFSIAFHPSTNGKSKRTTHNLEDILSSCVLQFKGN